ncbi:MAG: site-specific DNA-methyltransferase [Candidatus Thiodiazotropha endolucinida]|nr:site-specific DNA-methyltransferase [Candidatus Thiodiazotropha taylori]MCW4262551.1 site-specific DNA-methyltransferase [Candidatus Thiodiazotropha endolucinida]
MEKMTEKDGCSLDMVNENLQALKAIFPDAFTEDGVDFNALRQLLGDDIAEGEEKYGLNWHGKKKARQIALTPSTGTLRPCKDESVDWDTTQNLFIEGDNLEVLKLLQKSYAGKVKMIYIDPPYNTGNEFIYPDKYQDNLDTYLQYAGLKDEEGVVTSSEVRIERNSVNSGRYHTNWLNMMYPRIKLARSLLREDGSLWMSIDDNELGNLLDIGKSIFGDENFIACFVWHKRKSRENRKVFSVSHDYVLCFSKNKESFEATRKLLPLTEEARSRYSNPDSDPRGEWQSVSLNAQAGHGTPAQFYDITTPSGRVVSLPSGRCWAVTKERLNELISDNRVWFGKDGSNVPRQKIFLSEQEVGLTPHTLWSADEIGTTDTAKRSLNELFDGVTVFDTPKPTGLMERIIQIADDREGIFLDFFAGSSATAHAVCNVNVEDAGKRSYIMVQLPEPCDEKSEAYKNGYQTIAEIAKERIRRVAKSVRENDPEYSGDLGFKVFKLDSSNIIAWNPDRTDIESTLLNHTKHLMDGRSEEDVLYELLLKRGVDLTVPIEEKNVIGKSIYSIGYGVLFACLNETLSREEVEPLAQGIVDWHTELAPASDTQVVFRDSAFADDVSKTNMTAILEQHGIAHVRSL